MKTKHAEDLAKEYDFNTKEEYFNYIVDSLINGQRQQVKNLFVKMNNDSMLEFLNDFLNDDNSYHTSTRKICINALLAV